MIFGIILGGNFTFLKLVIQNLKRSKTNLNKKNFFTRYILNYEIFILMNIILD